MRLRRLAALVTQLLVIHVAIASGTPVCEMGEAATPSAATSAAHHELPHAPSHGDRHHGADCETACPPARCAASGHCASVVVRVADDASPSDSSSHAGVARAFVLAPPSVSTAPEPPPPRA